MLTVACIYWQGEFRRREEIYSPEWVGKLKNMVERNLDIPHRFVCLSNVDVPCERIPLERDWPGYWSKMELFKPGRFDDRVLYLDLDVVVVDNLEPIVNFPSLFGIVKAQRPKGLDWKEGKKKIGGYNSSVMVFDPGAGDCLYPEVENIYEKFWGDQDWIKFKLSNLDTFPEEWVKKLRDLPGGQPTKGLIVALCMLGRSAPNKNTSAIEKYKWIKDIWK